MLHGANYTFTNDPWQILTDRQFFDSQIQKPQNAEDLQVFAVAVKSSPGLFENRFVSGSESQKFRGSAEDQNQEVELAPRLLVTGEILSLYVIYLHTVTPRKNRKVR